MSIGYGMSQFDIKTTWDSSDLELRHTITMTENENEKTNEGDKWIGKGNYEKYKKMTWEEIWKARVLGVSARQGRGKG